MDAKIGEMDAKIREVDAKIREVDAMIRDNLSFISLYLIKYYTSAKLVVSSKAMFNSK